MRNCFRTSFFLLLLVTFNVSLVVAQTQTGAINGAVFEMGAKAGIAPPVNATLARLVQTIESGYDLQVDPY